MKIKNKISEYLEKHDIIDFLSYHSNFDDTDFVWERLHLSGGGISADERWKENAIKDGKPCGGIFDGEGISLEMVVSEIVQDNIEKIVDWVENDDSYSLKLKKYIPRFRIGLYYTPDGERHQSCHYVVTLMRAPICPFGFQYAGTTIEYIE